ncbi:MAG TPA: PrgI family protein [Candidatus Paceibacterota bacterium]|nr:PrgI family protein [Candidatus Paceibacterota bacterium]
MQYQVPQFIEVEDKLFGPLTFKQFVYIGGCLGLAYTSHVYVPYVGNFLALGAVGLGVCLAFVKVNNKPFIYVMEAFFKYLFHAKLYVWRKVPKKKEQAVEKVEKVAPEHVPTLNGSSLKDLAWSLDIHDRSMEGVGEGIDEGLEKERE